MVIAARLVPRSFFFIHTTSVITTQDFPCSGVASRVTRQSSQLRNIPSQGF